MAFLQLGLDLLRESDKSIHLLSSYNNLAHSINNKKCKRKKC